MEFIKNDLIDATLIRYYETFSRTLDTCDYVPSKYNAKILKYIFKNLKRKFKEVDREYKKLRKVYLAESENAEPDTAENNAADTVEPDATDGSEQHGATDTKTD